MILNETMNEIADAIREKTGKSELIKPVDFATEIKGITAGGGSGESPWKYYLLDWYNLDQEEGYTKELAQQIIHTLDVFYYTAYVMPSKATFTGVAAAGSDPENWGPWLYKAMRWSDTGTDISAEVGGMSPKGFLTSMGANMPFAATIAERMTECTEEEFYALTKKYVLATMV